MPWDDASYPSVPTSKMELVQNHNGEKARIEHRGERLDDDALVLRGGLMLISDVKRARSAGRGSAMPVYPSTPPMGSAWPSWSWLRLTSTASSAVLALGASGVPGSPWNPRARGPTTPSNWGKPPWLTCGGSRVVLFTRTQPSPPALSTASCLGYPRGMVEIPLVWVDFNDIDDDGRVITLRRLFAPAAAVEPGQRFLTGDDEGNTCPATVAWVREDGLVALDLDQRNFLPGSNSQSAAGS